MIHNDLKICSRVITHGIALTLLAACAPGSPLDGSVEEIKALVTRVVPDCIWGDTGMQKFADGQLRQVFKCDDGWLYVKNGEFETLESGFMNPDEQFPKKDHLDKYMPRTTAMVTALLPEWQGGRAWLETNINLGLGDSRIATEKVGDVWVVVESYGAAGGMSENGMTVVFVTKDPDIAKYGNSHYSAD